MFDWDDLRHFLATVRTGTYSAAGKELRVNRTTVARRVAALEEKLGCPLLEATLEGLRPTDAGKSLVVTAVEIEKQVQSASERLASEESTAAGTLKVAAPTGLGAEFMAEIAQFCHRYPNIEVELVTGANPAQLVSERKAEIGIVASNHPPEHLKGIAVGELKRAAYGGQQYLAAFPAETPLHQHHWVNWGRDMAQTLMSKWMYANLPEDIHVTALVNSWTAMREAVANNLGISMLWCFLADHDPRLLQIRKPEPGLSMGLWLLTHEDMPMNLRMEVFMETMPALLRQRIASTPPS